MNAVTELTAVCCENHTEYVNALCGQNEKSFNVKSGGKYGYRCSL